MASSQRPEPGNPSYPVHARGNIGQRQDATSAFPKKLSRCNSSGRHQTLTSYTARSKRGSAIPSTRATPVPGKEAPLKIPAALIPPALSSGSSSPLASLSPATSSDTLLTSTSSESSGTPALASPPRRRTRATPAAGPTYVSAAPFACDPAPLSAQPVRQRMSRVQSVNSLESGDSVVGAATVKSNPRPRTASTSTRQTVFRVHSMNGGTMTDKPLIRPATATKQGDTRPTVTRVQTVNSAPRARVKSAGRLACGPRGLGSRTESMTALSNPGLRVSASDLDLTRLVPVDREGLPMVRPRTAGPSFRNAAQGSAGYPGIRFQRAVSRVGTSPAPFDISATVNSGAQGHGLSRAMTINIKNVTCGGNTLVLIHGTEKQHKQSISNATGVPLSLEQRCRSIPLNLPNMGGGDEGKAHAAELAKASMRLQTSSDALASTTHMKPSAETNKPPLAAPPRARDELVHTAQNTCDSHSTEVPSSGKGNCRSMTVPRTSLAVPLPGLSHGALQTATQVRSPPHSPAPTEPTPVPTPPASEKSAKDKRGLKMRFRSPFTRQKRPSTAGGIKIGRAVHASYFSGGEVPAKGGAASKKGAKISDSAHATKAPLTDATQGHLQEPSTLSRTFSPASTTTQSTLACFRPWNAGPARPKGAEGSADETGEEADTGAEVQGGNDGVGYEKVVKNLGERGEADGAVPDAKTIVKEDRSPPSGRAMAEEGDGVAPAGQRSLPGMRPKTAAGVLERLQRQPLPVCSARLRRPCGRSVFSREDGGKREAESGTSQNGVPPRQGDWGVTKGHPEAAVGWGARGTSLKGLISLDGLRGAFCQKKVPPVQSPSTGSGPGQGKGSTPGRAAVSEEGTPVSVQLEALSVRPRLGDALAPPGPASTYQDRARGPGQGDGGKSQGSRRRSGIEGSP